MKASRKTLINVSLGVVIVGAIAGGLLLLNPFGVSTAAKEIQLTSTVQQGTVSSTITATGNVQPVREVTSSFSISGTLATVNVAVGDTVTAGTVLGTLSTTTLSAQLSAAYSQLSAAQSNLTLANTSLTEAKAAAAAPTTSTGTGTTTSGVTSVASAQQQVNTASSSVTNASSAVTTAKENLAAATLSASIGGLVIAVNGSVGDASGGGGNSTTGFVTIADTSKLTVTAAIAEADIGSVTVGQDATVTFPALESASAPATVTAIAPTATTSNSIVTYATTITLTSVPDNLRLGQTANVAITTASSTPDALYIPSVAITTANGVSTVKVVAADGTTSEVTVTLGVVGDAGTEITSGLSAGETIVLGTVSPSTTTSGGTGTTGIGEFGGTGNFPGGFVPGENRRGTQGNTNQGGGN
jgi:RND family efflux transporter MFP subunit